jgi:hypothetical protein
MPEWAKASQPERETTIQWAEDERIAHIYTASPAMARRLSRNPLAKLTETHTDLAGRITGLEFEIPVYLLTIRTSTRRGGVLTPAQQAALLLARRASEKKRQRGHPSGDPGPV